MFKDLNTQIEILEEQRRNLDADWEDVGSHALLDFYVRIMPKVLDCERCSIFIHDPMRQSAWLKAGTGVAEKEIELSLEQDSIVGKVIASGEATLIKDLDSAEGEHKNTDQQTGFITRDILCVPIRSLDGNAITGAVQLLNKQGDESFSESDQQLLEEMVHYLELSLENIYFHADATETVKHVFKYMSMVLTVTLSGVLLVGLLLAVYWAGI